MQALDLTISGHAPDDSADGALQGQTGSGHHGASSVQSLAQRYTSLQLASYRGSKGPPAFHFDLSTPPSHWYDETGQSSCTAKTDLTVRNPVSDSLIRNMPSSRQPEMIFRALQSSCPVPLHTEEADTDPAAGHALLLFNSLVMVFAPLLPLKSHKQSETPAPP